MGKFSPAAAEAMAAMVAMELCKELGLIHVYLEGDAKTIIEAVNRKEAD
jgi:ribonuclease HI